jgi:hypothetical protein
LRQFVIKKVNYLWVRQQAVEPFPYQFGDQSTS